MPTGARDRAAQARGHGSILDHSGCGSSVPISCGLVGDVGRLPVGNGASDSCKTHDALTRTVAVMTSRFSVIGIVVDDMGRALDFYRRLGLAIPDEAASEGHVEVLLPGDLKLAFDTVETIHSFNPSWKPPRATRA